MDSPPAAPDTFDPSLWSVTGGAVFLPALGLCIAIALCLPEQSNRSKGFILLPVFIPLLPMLVFPAVPPLPELAGRLLIWGLFGALIWCLVQTVRWANTPLRWLLPIYVVNQFCAGLCVSLESISLLPKVHS